MLRLFLFLFVISCSIPNSNINITNEILDFNEELTFNEFNELLIEYVKTSPYPNINK